MDHFDKLPERMEDLADLKIDIPYLADNSARSCPVSMDAILDYLSVETLAGDSLEEDDLEFIRTALIEDDIHYWIWKFTDSDDSECYVKVLTSPAGGHSIGYDSNGENLTPEQYIVKDFLELVHVFAHTEE